MNFEKRGHRLLVLALLMLGAFAGAMYLYFQPPGGIPFLSCVVYDWLGLYCPGCGAGRACYAILHGEWYQAFRYNPLLMILFPWFALYLVLWIGDWVWNWKNRVDQLVPFKLVLVLLIIVIMYGILRNIPIYPLTLLQPYNIQ